MTCAKKIECSIPNAKHCNHRLLVSHQIVQDFHGKRGEFLPSQNLRSIFLNACVKCLSEGVGFWGSVDTGGTGAWCDAIVCELGLSFRTD